MTRQDLLHQRGAGTGQSENEDGQTPFPSRNRQCAQTTAGVDVAIRASTNARYSAGSCSCFRARKSARRKALARRRCSAASSYLPSASSTRARPNSNGDAPVTADFRFRQQLPHRRQVVLRQAASQDERELAQRLAQPAPGFSELPAWSARSADSRLPPVDSIQPLRPDRPGPARPSPGCGRPRQNRASAPVPGGSRPPLRPASPVP